MKWNLEWQTVTNYNYSGNFEYDHPIKTLLRFRFTWNIIDLTDIYSQSLMYYWISDEQFPIDHIKKIYKTFSELRLSIDNSAELYRFIIFWILTEPITGTYSFVHGQYEMICRSWCFDTIVCIYNTQFVCETISVFHLGILLWFNEYISSMNRQHCLAIPENG